MPFPDSEYPSIMRGKNKRESQRLLAAAPEMLNALRGAARRWDELDEEDDPVLGAAIRSAIASAEGRSWQ
jgi:hypothetical protein